MELGFESEFILALGSKDQGSRLCRVR